jgi:hypothetical protein
MKRMIVPWLFMMCMAASARTVMETETVKALKRTGSLSTCFYTPTTAEKQFFAKLGPSEITTGSFMQPYSIHHKKDTYVSWFAIVRGMTRDEKDGSRVRLLLEQKYFDGMTDCHIMLVSVKGDGDFLADLETEGIASIPPLALVRVYGKVLSEEGDVPAVAAEYLRVWPWLTFTETDLGAEDHGNPKWRKLCRICSGRVYNPYPNENYYLQLLGDPKDFPPLPGR